MATTTTSDSPPLPRQSVGLDDNNEDVIHTTGDGSNLLQSLHNNHKKLKLTTGSKPSRVVHIRNIPSGVTETEIVNMGECCRWECGAGRRGPERSDTLLGKGGAKGQVGYLFRRGSIF